MRARGKGVGISFKIALIFMILSGAFWIILFIQFYYSSDQEAKEYVESLSEQAMSSISKNIEMIIGNVSFHSRQILSNGDLIHSLKEEQPEQQQKYLYEFISLTDFESYMNGIYIMDMQDHMCSIDRMQVRTLRVQHTSDIGWYEEVLNLNGSYCLKLNADRVLTGSSAHPTLSLIRAIIDPLNFQKIGILMINIDLEAFKNYCDNLENVPNLYILDDTGKIIYSKGDIKLPEMQKNRRQEEGTVVNDTFYNFMTIESNNWTILTASPITRAFSGVNNSRRFFTQTIEILALFSIVSYLIINYLVGRPLINMAKRMNIQKNYRFEKLTYKEKPFRSCREVEQLKTTYNEMTDDINDLVKRVTEEIPHTYYNGSRDRRHPGNANITFEYIEGEAILLYLDFAGISASSGSACSSKSLQPSHVLTALGIPVELIHGSIRFTFGDFTTMEDTDYAVDQIKKITERLREISSISEKKGW